MALNRNIWFVLFVTASIYLFYISWGVISPFIASFVFAYLISPIIKFLEEKTNIPRWLLSLLTVSFIFTLFILLWVVLVPLIYDQVAKFAAHVPEYKVFVVNRVYPEIQEFISKIDASYMAKIQQGIDNIFSTLLQGGMDLINKIWQSGYAVVNIITIVFLVPLISFYMIRDWEKIYKNIIEMVPMQNRNKIQKLLKDINNALSGFIRGQLTICLILASYYAIGLSIIGLEYGALIGVTTGLISFIPFIGFASGFVIAIIVGYFQAASWMMFIKIAVVFVIGNVIESLLSPKIVGNKIGLHPVWVIFAILLGASLLGFFGMLVAIPIAAIVNVLIRFFIDIYKNSAVFSNNKKRKSK
jgi:sporulation integral membrane protein YtvI